METPQQDYHTELKQLIHQYVRKVYSITKQFPKEELFGLTSQFRRATLSVMLNYVEGYARRRKAVLKNFLEISYGSLKESQYLVQLSWELNYMQKVDSDELLAMTDRIGRMLWGIFSKL